MTKYAVKAMEQHNYGRILLLASIAGKEGNPFMAGYSSMKAGVIGLVKGIGKEYAQTGITVNGLAPAVIKTAMNENTAPEQLTYMTAKIPMGRLGTVDEVASIASWEPQMLKIKAPKYFYHSFPRCRDSVTPICFMWRSKSTKGL